MATVANVNKRILDEVEKMKTSKEIKSLLKHLLEIELEEYDKQKPHYVEKYKEAFLKHLRI